jgi:hypothetical protein
VPDARRERQPVTALIALLSDPGARRALRDLGFTD